MEKEIGALWSKESKNGNPYFSGTIKTGFPSCTSTAISIPFDS